MNISWTPGRASIVRNKIANALAKEAASEAKNQPECSRSTTLHEIKEASKKSQLSKWQSRWDNTEYGRAYHMLVPNVDTKKFLDIPNRKSFCQSLQIQTGYSKLNNYRNKLGQCDSNEFSCGEPETPEHFLIHCPNYIHCRETMQLKLSSQLGCSYPTQQCRTPIAPGLERNHTTGGCSLHRGHRSLQGEDSRQTSSKSLIHQSTSWKIKVHLRLVTFVKMHLHARPAVQLRPPEPKRPWIED